MKETAQAARRFLRVDEVIQLTGVKQSTLYNKIAAGKFPKPVKLGPRMSVWDESEIRSWQDAMLAERG